MFETILLKNEHILSKKDKILIKKVKQCLDKIDSINDNDIKAKTRNGLNRVEYLLNGMAFSILVDINEKRSKEAKQELIEELSDMLKVNPFDI